ncbi:energy transducer TonB [Bacteroides gallinaceum]|uniref:energy transducer TonB n=1 Tax=Bacteroides gallinaceum TaxID=1462571 RepID=UPI0025AB32BF|nr:energy transducer TonB [Bacteroides gallinaceum]MDN0080097.1 energy transducer TonB [Bacteroides gallinaceum]
MIYPEEMLKQGKGGYAFCQLDLDTLGIATNILTIQSSHESFAEEVTRLLRQMPHALPALDKQGKPVSCTYGIYVQFRPYRYQRRLKEKQEWKARADSMFVDYDSSASFPGGMYKLQQYFKQNLIEVYGQGNASGVRGVYRFKITDYGYPEEVKVLHPGPFPDFDEQVLHFIRKMPRWTPAVDWHASPYTFKDCICTLPVQLPSHQVKK